MAPAKAFSWEFCELFINTFLQNTSGRLFLKIKQKNQQCKVRNCCSEKFSSAHWAKASSNLTKRLSNTILGFCFSVFFTNFELFFFFFFFFLNKFLFFFFFFFWYLPGYVEIFQSVFQLFFGILAVIDKFPVKNYVQSDINYLFSEKINYPFSKYALFSEKLLFFTTCYAHARFCIRG